MEIFLEYIDKVGLIGIIVAVTAFLVGRNTKRREKWKYF